MFNGLPKQYSENTTTTTNNNNNNNIFVGAATQFLHPFHSYFLFFLTF